MKLKCKNNLTLPHHLDNINVFIDHFISGRVYEIKRIYNLSKMKTNRQRENIWVMIGELDFELFFNGPEAISNVNLSTPLFTYDLTSSYQLMDYFYLPAEWRELQLEKLCI